MRRAKAAWNFKEFMAAAQTNRLLALEGRTKNGA
jgi:hypothetical protein